MNAGTRYNLCQCAGCNMRRLRDLEQTEHDREKLAAIIREIAERRAAEALKKMEQSNG